MGIIFNPLSGTFDFTGTSGGGGGGLADRYVDTFNATTDWSGPSGGLYTITVTAATHAKGGNPNVQVYELVGSDYELVQPNSLVINGLGDVTISTLQTPDTRFAGLILII